MLPAGQVYWNPTDSVQFAVSADDLRIYNLDLDDPHSPFHLASTYDQRVPVLTCIAWAPNSIVGGLPSGKVILLDTTGRDGHHEGHIIKQFIPKYSRRCMTLEFNPNVSTQFICGLDKVRNASSGLIFDIEQTGTTSSEQLSSDLNSPVVQEPLVQFSKSESISAAAWLRCLPQCLAVCSGMKWVRMYDIRAGSDPVQSIGAHTKFIFSLSVSKLNDRLLSALSEDGLLNVWDVRMNQQYPLLTSLFLSGVLPNTAQWSSRTSGIMATSFNENSQIEFYEVGRFIRSSPPSDECIPKLVATNCLTLPFPVASFDLHPTWPNTLIALTTDSRLHFKKYRESKAIDVSCFGLIAFSCDTEFQVLPASRQDISDSMMERVKAGYALDIAHNRQLFAPLSELADPDLFQLWNFLYISSAAANEISSRSVRECLTRDSDSIERLVNGVGLFESEARSQACRLLGWCQIENQFAIDNCIASLCKQGDFEIAVAMAVFHLDFVSALNLLQSAIRDTHREDLSFVCLALSSFVSNCSSDDHGDVWSVTARMIVKEIRHPYVRAAVRFLSCSRNLPDYSDILNDSAVNFRDRLAFACRYLNEAQLRIFVESALKNAIDSGSLDGIVLCGLSSESFGVLRSYLDQSADIQTVAIISSLVFSSIDSNQPANQWFERCINVYRDLVDRWKLWSYRAKFDIARHRVRPAGTILKERQASAACRHCRQSLVQSDLLLPRSSCVPVRFTSPISISHRCRVQACPSCKKLLPRCSICMLSLNSSMMSVQSWHQSHSLSEIKCDNGRSTDQWISWCVVCHHAGHGLHMEQWFSQHERCPVTGCSCSCR